MNNIALNSVIQTTFDLFRLSKSKSVVDVCPNTLRAYAKRGLPIYKQGKAVFVSKKELIHFIRTPTKEGKETKKNPSRILTEEEKKANLESSRNWKR